jgi:hypothetical protein
MNLNQAVCDIEAYIINNSPLIDSEKFESLLNDKSFKFASRLDQRNYLVRIFSAMLESEWGDSWLRYIDFVTFKVCNSHIIKKNAILNVNANIQKICRLEVMYSLCGINENDAIISKMKSMKIDEIRSY